MAVTKKPDPAAALRGFLETYGVGVREAGRQLRVQHTTVLAWISGDRVPESLYREAIERWTRGAVPASWWTTDAERELAAKLAEVTPFGGEAA